MVFARFFISLYMTKAPFLYGIGVTYILFSVLTVAFDCKLIKKPST